MRKLIVLVSFLFSLSATAEINPYAVMEEIGIAAKAGDEAKLETLVDFNSIREKLYNSMVRAIAEESKSTDNPERDKMLTDMAEGMARQIADSVASSEGLVDLLADADLDEMKGSVGSTEFKGLSEFVITLKAEEGETPVKLVLTRSGVSWKLSDIVAPGL